MFEDLAVELAEPKQDIDIDEFGTFFVRGTCFKLYACANEYAYVFQVNANFQRMYTLAK